MDWCQWRKSLLENPLMISREEALSHEKIEKLEQKYRILGYHGYCGMMIVLCSWCCYMM